MLTPHRQSTSTKMLWAITLLFFGLAPLTALASPEAAPDGPKKELVAVMDFQVMGATPQQAAALSNQFRQEIMKTGIFQLVDRNQLDTIMKEQALQNSGCTDQKCAVQLGAVLGVKKIFTGTVNSIGDDLWQVSVQMTDVETAATLKVENLNHNGKFATLLFEGMSSLATKMASSQAAGKMVAKTPESSKLPGVEQAPAAPEPDDGLSGWRWKWGTTLTLGALTGLISMGNASAVSSHNANSARFMTAAQQAVTLTEYQSNKNLAESEYQQAKAAADSASTMQMVSLISLGLGAWFYWDKPTAPTAWVQPTSDHNGWLITYQQRW